MFISLENIDKFIFENDNAKLLLKKVFEYQPSELAIFDEVVITEKFAMTLLENVSGARHVPKVDSEGRIL